MTRIVIQGGRLIDPLSGLDEVGDLAIADGRIVHLGGRVSDFTPEQTIDATGHWVVPGLVDLAARLREPGGTRKADIASEARAAAAGGITTLVMPPDTVPVLDTPSVAELVTQRAERAAQARVVPLGALTQGLDGAQLPGMAALAAAGCPAVSDGGRPVRDGLVLRRALEYASTYDLPALLTPVDPDLAGGCMHEGPTATRLGLAGIPAAAETAGLGRQLGVAGATRARVHFGRLSSAAGIRLLASARREQPTLSADVAIHQLFLTDQDVVGYDSRFHVTPPLRDIVDREALRQAVASGEIPIICSDHQPHDRDAKNGPFASTEPGAAGLDTLLALIMRLVDENVLPLRRALAAVTVEPARLLGLESGRLAVGAVADIAVVAERAPWFCRADTLKSRGQNSPFLGWEFDSQVMHTLVEGRRVYDANPAD